MARYLGRLFYGGHIFPSTLQGAQCGVECFFTTDKGTGSESRSWMVRASSFQA